MFKRLFFFGSILGGAVLLSDPVRRDRLMTQGRGWLDKVRSRLGIGQAQGQGDTVLPPIRDYGAPYTPTGAGV